jgi:hypothetical protein
MLAGHCRFWPHDDCTVLDSIVYDSVWYPESLSREAVSIMQGVSMINIKTQALKKLPLNLFCAMLLNNYEGMLCLWIYKRLHIFWVLFVL